MPIKLGDCDENEEGSFFFWLAKQRNLGTTPPPKESLVIWLNGGPGKEAFRSSNYPFMHQTIDLKDTIQRHEILIDVDVYDPTNMKNCSVNTNVFRLAVVHASTVGSPLS